MNGYTKTEKLVRAALLAALTCIATIAIKLPTPQGGYVHFGDGFVLTAGIIMGPLYGGLAAGIGSFLGDLIGGYAAFAPFTLIVKAITAIIAALMIRFLNKINSGKNNLYINLSISGFIAELFMILGYFITNVMIITANSGYITRSSLASASAAAMSSIPFDILQASIGIIFTTALSSLLARLMNGNGSGK